MGNASTNRVGFADFLFDCHSVNPPDAKGFFLRHDADKIDSDIFRVDFVFYAIYKNRPSEGSSFCGSIGVERVSEEFGLAVFYFEEHDLSRIVFSGDDVDFSSLDLEIPLHDRISLGLDMARDAFFYLVAERSVGFRVWSVVFSHDGENKKKSLKSGIRVLRR